MGVRIYVHVFFVVVFFRSGVCAHVQLRVGVYHREEKEGGKGRVRVWCGGGRGGCCYFGPLECSLH